MRRLLCTVLPLAICAAALVVPTANAAVTAAYVGCSPTAATPPSHACLVGDVLGAFFESDAEVEYEICLDTPIGEPSCIEEERAEADVLYVNEITTDAPGNYLVTWYVGEVEVASWGFRMDPRPTPPPTTPPPVTIPPPPPPTPSAIGCAVGKGGGFSFLEHPSRCVAYRQSRRDRAHEIVMRDLRWTGWGRATATAKGSWRRCAKGSCSPSPLKATASEPILACGHFGYTRLKLQLTDGKRQRTYQLQLPTC